MVVNNAAAQPIKGSDVSDLIPLPKAANTLFPRRVSVHSVRRWAASGR